LGADALRGRALAAACRCPVGLRRQIEARGQWILPGSSTPTSILSLYGGQNDRYESLVRYQPRRTRSSSRPPRIDLSYGITTVRDSYGALVPLVKVRDAIARGATQSARGFSPRATSSAGAGRIRFRSAGAWDS
jgi:hypothetical protein